MKASFIEAFLFLNFLMSNSPKVERKLAAIMFTDIEGYTESMSCDESQAITAVKKKRSIIQPLIKEYNGVFVKEIGDGTLSYFSSAIDASTCAVKLQELTYDEDHLNLRIGLHIGDIVFDGQDVFGEGVNIASRLESLSPVGGVCVSKTVYDELENKKEFNGTSLGLQSLKGVGRLVEVYALKGDRLKEPDTSKYKETEVQKHTDSGVPSIAIIPFENKGADEDVFYAYGISSDLISDCSSAGLIRVAGLKDIEKLDYTNLKYQELSKELLVRYVSQGTLWKMGEMFQLSIELYDTKEKKVIWSDRWQEKWDNLPTIKGNLSDGLLKALDRKPKVEKKAETTNAEAYEFYLKAKHKYDKRENTEDVEIVRGLLRKAIELDDTLIAAKILLGTTYTDMSDFDKAMEICTSALKQSKSLGDEPTIAHSLNNIGRLYFYKGDKENALDYFTQALIIYKKLDNKKIIGGVLSNIGAIYNQNNEIDKAIDKFNQFLIIGNELNDKKIIEFCLNNIGTAYANKGDCDMALEYFIRSLKINEELGEKFRLDLNLNNIGVMNFAKGDYDKALEYFIRSLKINEDLGVKRGILMTLFNTGIVYLNKGDYKKAVEALEKSLSIQKGIGVKAGQLRITVNLYIGYAHLGKAYDEKDIHRLVKDTENIDFETNIRLYQLLEDNSYLETAYNQIEEKVAVMDTRLKKKFLNYPIPKEIVEEWEKINN